MQISEIDSYIIDYNKFHKYDRVLHLSRRRYPASRTFCAQTARLRHRQNGHKNRPEILVAVHLLGRSKSVYVDSGQHEDAPIDIGHGKRFCKSYEG